MTRVQFIAYGVAFPESFLCLIDTYDTLNSGLRNFILVSLALNDCGYHAKGIRLDSGDLSYISIECETIFQEMATRFNRPFFRDLDIVASNDINEDVLHSLNKQGHAITIFGIGTNLVTCQNIKPIRIFNIIHNYPFDAFKMVTKLTTATGTEKTL